MRMPCRLLVLLLLCSLLLPGVILQAHTDPVAGIIRRSLQGARIERGISAGACRLISPSVLPELYKRRAYQPIWTRPEAVAQLVTAIRESYSEGLNPRDYHLGEIRSILARSPSARQADPLLAASLDMLLTDAFILLASHSTCGKEDPATHQPLWNHKRTLGGKDPVDFFEKELASPSITRTVDSWKVHHPYYERLKQALAAYRSIRSKGGWGLMPEDEVLKMGVSGPGVAALRRRLAVEDTWIVDKADSQLFDEELHQAVWRFQDRHSIRRDGIAGSETLTELNIPVDERIDQIRINLERCRWVLRKIDDTFVLVDIAGFMIYLQKHGRIVWSGRVVVGQPYRDTPVLRSRITYMEVNPTWTIPPTILDDDILPEIRDDPFYLARRNIVIVDGKGLLISPDTLDWSLYPGRPFPFRLVQNPGAGNPLGRIKIMFPNEYQVYLHDTPDKTLFDQEDRTFSSGCIRVERPFELAGLLLDGYAGWTAQRLMKSADTGLTWRINLPRPVPVLLMYSTVTVDSLGVVFFKKDPYARDPAMLQGLGRDSDISPDGA